MDAVSTTRSRAEVKRKVKKIFLFISVTFIIISTVLIQYNRLSYNGKYNTIVAEYTSPDGRYKAVIFERNVNVTTKQSYHLSILKGEELLGGGTGNVYICYEQFDVQWINNNELRIINGNAQNIFKSKVKYKDISILYDK